MENNTIDNYRKNRQPGQEKILLVVLPYWTPAIPPAGISCLKSFLQQHKYRVKCVDANVEPPLREIYDKYFNTLKSFIPQEKQSIFDNIGKEVWQNHMMVHLNYVNEKRYVELVKTLVYETFYWKIYDHQVYRLNRIVAENYVLLEKYIDDLLEKEKPTLLGISVFIGTTAASLFAFQRAKKKYPHLLTVMGGAIFSGPLAPGSPNLEYFLEKTRNYIDKIIIGEGEILFLKLLQGKLPPQQRVFTLTDIGGKVLDLSTVKVMEMSDFNLPYYPYLASYASRSCPYQCKFCSESILWGIYRRKSARQVVDELNQLYRRHGYQLFVMTDVLMNPMVTELAETFIESDLSIYWDTHFRVDKQSGHPEKTMLWRRGGLYRVELGVESGSQSILDAMGKKITVEQIKNALSALAYAGIKTTTYWIIGYPGETEQDFQLTLDLVEEIKDDIYEAELNPFWYVPGGQVNADAWAKQGKPLYPETAKDLLIVQQWILTGEPTREERYDRANRFTAHCRQLGIPNPYSLNEIYIADKRWKRLHENSVPALMEFKQKGVYIDENKRLKTINTVSDSLQHDGDWGFGS
ncbi:MAG: radical SAM protein [Candidatus Aminicenantes bacterium]|jgi:radical SAM superfamily enzyme YgiQ (UPF0313 family)